MIFYIQYQAVYPEHQHPLEVQRLWMVPHHTSLDQILPANLSGKKYLDIEYIDHHSVLELHG